MDSLNKLTSQTKTLEEIFTISKNANSILKYYYVTTFDKRNKFHFTNIQKR